MSAELLSLSKSITPCPIFFKTPCKYVFILVACLIVSLLFFLNNLVIRTICGLSGLCCCVWTDCCESAGMPDWQLDQSAARPCFVGLLRVCWCIGSGSGRAGCSLGDPRAGATLIIARPDSGSTGCSALGVPGLVLSCWWVWGLEGKL